ncbi:MAG: hypothetical protein OEQ13_06500, partial [Acidobacteriota bacterium]|nr:hypothetical protein [Acidobacteriota bacterium]
MSTPPTYRGPSSAPDAVIQGFVDAWNRMVWILFKGPHASFVNWAWWGVIILLAGVMSGGGGNSGSSIDADSFDKLGWDTPGAAELSTGIVALIVGLVCCVLLVVVAFIYIRSRFRFILLDDVLSGVPNVKEPWSRTSEVGLQYFIWEILVGLVCLLLALPIILMWLPILGGALRGASIDDLISVGLIVLTVLYLITLAIVKAVVDWFVYDLALPLSWCRTGNFWSGLRSAAGLLR